MRSRSLLSLVFLLLFLTFALLEDSQVIGQDTIPQAREKLVEALNAVRDAEAQGVAPSDIIELTRDLNRALDLESSNATMSMELSSQIISRAIALKSESRAADVRTAILSYSVALWFAILSALVILDAHRITRFVRRRIAPVLPEVASTAA